MHLMELVKRTVQDKFRSSESENMFCIGRYLYSSFLLNLSMFFLVNYQPLNTSIFVYKRIIEIYSEKTSDGFISNETPFLFIIYYNTGLLSYIEGNNNEAIQFLLTAKKIIQDKDKKVNNLSITLLRNVVVDYNNVAKYLGESKSELSKAKEISERMNNVNNPLGGVTRLGKRGSLCANKLNQDFMNILSKETDKKINGSNSDVTKKNSRKKSSKNKDGGSKLVYTGKNNRRYYRNSNVTFNDNDRFQEYIKDRLSISIDLLIAEIELDQKQFKEAWECIKNICEEHGLNFMGGDKGSSPRTKSKTSLAIENNTEIKKLVRNSSKITNNSNNNAIINKSRTENETLNNIIVSDNNVLENNNNNNLKNNDIAPSEETNRKYNNKEIINEDFHDRLTETEKKQIYTLSNAILNGIEGKEDENIEQIEIINTKNNMAKELEKFFLFICGLSVYQLKVLNEFQPDSKTNRNDLPILFPNQFQDCTRGKEYHGGASRLNDERGTCLPKLWTPRPNQKRYRNNRRIL